MSFPLYKRIFVNRNLRFSGIKAIGFDMDHTIAQYKRRPVETLAINELVNKLITAGYPQELKKFSYDPNLAIRGLVIDFQYGNLLKLNQYKYVVRAYHGRHVLSDKKRKSLYSGQTLRLSDTTRFYTIDTFFGFPEVMVYMELLDIFSRKKRALNHDDFRRFFRDIRSAIDISHQDNTIKTPILGNLSRYFYSSPGLYACLNKFKKAGKKLFFLTNSDMTYTDAIMNFLLRKQLPAKTDWKSIFDLIIVEARKPDFYKRGTPYKKIMTGSRNSPPVFRGGNYSLLYKNFENKGNKIHPDEILYFGDHTYGDILKTKENCGWRTVMIIPELKNEIRISNKTRELRRALHKLYKKKAAMKIAIIKEYYMLNKVPEGDNEKKLTMDIYKQINSMEKKVRRAANPVWGSSLFAGREISRFADQVMNYACLFTARVENFIYYPDDFYFESSPRFFPWESELSL